MNTRINKKNEMYKPYRSARTQAQFHLIIP